MIKEPNNAAIITKIKNENNIVCGYGNIYYYFLNI